VCVIFRKCLEKGVKRGYTMRTELIKDKNKLNILESICSVDLDINSSLAMPTNEIL
jgi:hypothetical protein